MILGLYKEQKEEYAHLIQRTLQEHLIDQQTMQKEFEEMMTENPNIKRQNTPIRKDTVVKRRKMSYGAVVRNDDEEEEIDDDSVRTHHRRRTGAMTAASPFFGMGMNTTGLMMHSVLQQRDIREFDGMLESNASKFIREYEKMVANYTDQAKVDTFPRYLTGAAAN